MWSKHTALQLGTNGGVTTLGLLASGAGGLAVGIAFWLGGLLVPLVTGRWGLLLDFAAQWPVLAIGAGSGIVGSLLDSLLAGCRRGPSYMYQISDSPLPPHIHTYVYLSLKIYREHVCVVNSLRYEGTLVCRARLFSSRGTAASEKRWCPDRDLR